jgi:predicted DNA-binding protein YlxM (UPF0122 family)
VVEPGAIALLLDYYGNLLTERQAEMLDLHCNEDQSLSEIAEHFGVSRQSVHDAVRVGAEALQAYEAKLGFAEAHGREAERLEAIAADAERLAAALRCAAAGAAGELTERIEHVERIELTEHIEHAERIARLAREELF